MAGNFSESTIVAYTSTSNDTFDYELEWWICTGLSVPLGVFALYVAVTQIIYCLLKLGRSTKAGERRTSSTTSTSHKSKSSVQGQQHAFVLNVMCAIGAVCAFLRAGIDFRLVFGRNTDLGCDVSIKFKLAGYAVSLIAVYLVLWLRQRIFYQHPRLKHLSSGLIRVVSWSMSVLIVSGLVSTAIIFFAVGKYVGVPDGCIVQKSALTSIRWIILVGCTTFFQICLLTLFVYPLVKHNMSVRSATAGDKKKNPVIPLIKRATITSAVCVVTDIAFALIILVLKREIVTMSTFIYDVNIVTNVMCMIFSFPDWKTRLMPWRVTSSENQDTDVTTEGTSKNRTSESNI